ncbi:GDSL family lipase [Sphingobacterium olei]|uniref:GDSL family lipase n=1 Tax=Sphingobacterium olei TaxID=2571155 RepID=A0A4U0NG89_9SPHI|nr:GDSL-type esterase/lipase family protein [Sphingobacterium olei]TJZ53175.1 GDSL family lipase [Sphingobacterium olei]
MQINNIEIQWRNEIELLRVKVRQIPEKSGLVAFYGSSTFRLWEDMQEDLAPCHLINLAFGGSTYEDCIYFFPELFACLNPEYIVLYAGDNDLSQGKSPATVLQDLKRMVSLIQKTFPEIHIAVVSIKPSPDRLLLLEKVIKTNDLIEYYASENDILFINTFHRLIDTTGKPCGRYYQEDGLHLNKGGYKIWSSTIRTTLLIP